MRELETASVNPSNFEQATLALYTLHSAQVFECINARASIDGAVICWRAGVLLSMSGFGEFIGACMAWWFTSYSLHLSPSSDDIFSGQFIHSPAADVYRFFHSQKSSHNTHAL